MLSRAFSTIYFSELFTLNISCGPPPSPEAVEIDI